MLIERHPDVPDHFLVLERKESFGDYARSYGSGLAEHCENHGIIVMPFTPIDFDLALFQSLAFPIGWKKIGTANGIDRMLYTREDGEVKLWEGHPLLHLGRGIEWASYLQAQIASFDAQLRQGLSVLFPAYHSLRDANITWRLTQTDEEGMHLDTYADGAPSSASHKTLHRVKIFINIDSEPRVWRTSFDLPGVLHACRDELPVELPDDVNVVNGLLYKFGVLKNLPAHRIAFPAMAAVISNSEVVAHEVVYGRRVVGGEFLCDQGDMLDPKKLVHRRLRDWLDADEYTIEPDAAIVAQRYADMKAV